MSSKPSSKRSRRRAPGGRFDDLEALLEQLGSSPVVELGKPLPDRKFLPKGRVGRSPEAHNQALLDHAERANSRNNHSPGASL